MTKVTKLFSILIVLCLSIYAETLSAQRHWVGSGGGNGRFWNKTANWSATQGGAGGAGVPTASDDVFIDGGGNLEINTAAVCLSFNQSLSTGTKDFANNSSLTVGSGGFVISGGTLSLNFNDDTITVSGNVTISGGALEIIGTTPVLNVAGNWSLSGGTFTQTTGIVTFNGSSGQTITGTTSFFNLTINNAAGVTLGSSVTVNGTLTLTSGIITTGANTLSIASTGSVTRTSGHINGNLQKNVATGATSRTFEIGDATSFTPVTVAFASVTTAGNLTTSTTAGDHPNIVNAPIDASKGVNRYWTLTNGGVVFTTYSATFNFIAGDVDGGANTANFNVSKYNAPNWTSPTTGTRTATSTQATGLTSFSDFAIGEAKVITISASAGANGSISPSGSIVVSYGGSQTFTITPNAHYHIADVLVDGSSVGAVGSYTFTGVTTSHTISASFAIDTYTITASAGANGSISPSGAVSVDYGSDQTFTITPNTGYHVADVLVDGSSVGAAGSYTFTAVTANHTISASFAIDVFTITASAGANGSISPSGAVSVDYGNDQTFTITPDANYHIADVLVDGSSIGATGSHTFTGVTANHTISASFAIDVFTITASAGANGSISPSGAVSVDYGNDQTFTITPDAHYHIADVLVDGSSVGAVGSYTFTGVVANHTISASFAIDTYTITASAGANGSISPSGAVSVDYGNDQSFTITPSTGYHVADVLVDGSSIGATGSYTFTGVTANHTISASFAIDVFTITASAGANGSISPSGAVSVDYGDDETFTITPDVGYYIADVHVDSVSVGAVGSYTFTGVTANHTISASFAINMYTISASAGANGTISPSGAVSVDYGSDKTFTITPEVGYYVADVHVDSISIGATTSYTFTNVTANHTIEALFAIQTFKVSASAGSGGSMSPSGSTIVDYGSSLAFTVTPDVGYYIADVHVDTTSLGAVSSFTLTNITENHTVTATFGINMYKITTSAGAHGTISPTGSVMVDYGDSATFTITPDVGYYIADVHADTASLGAVSSYTFHNVTANHSISATFAINTYKITASAGSNGTISPSGSVLANYGDTVHFTITPDNGYYVSDVHVDSISVGSVTSYTFAHVSANHSIDAAFSLIPNQPPTTFGLIAPTINDTVFVELTPTNVDFLWHPSTDADVMDTLKYTIYVKGPGLDTSVTGLMDTTVTLGIVPRLQIGSTYTWAVDVTDGHYVVASSDTFSFYVASVVAVNESRVPTVYALHQNYPNPFNPSTVIQFDLPHQSVVTLAVYNLLGQQVATLIDHRQMDIGYQKSTFDAGALPSGVYFYRIMAEEKSGNQFVSVKRMLIVK